METVKAIINELVKAMPPITLEEMAAIKLMNRTDTKFVTNLQVLYKLLSLARDSYYSQETCRHRICPYSTTYWDVAEGHTMFRNHLCGHSPRVKVRVRTYLDTAATFLEIKRKDNHGVTAKTRIAVPSLDAVVNDRNGEEFLETHTAYTFSDQRPTLSNRFHRVTLVYLSKTERLTIDFGLTLYNSETGNTADTGNVVGIELKRDGRAASPILGMIRQLRIKPSGFSKYCIGTSLTNDMLLNNRLKPRLRGIEKITKSTHPDRPPMPEA